MKKLHWLCLFLLAGGVARAVPAPIPAILLTPTTIDFDVPFQGADPTPGQLVIKNNGTGGKMDWQAAEDTDQPWLDLSKLTGPDLNPNASAQVGVKILMAGVAAGDYSTKIKVTSAAAGNSPQWATVNLHVSATARIGLTPAAMTFAAPQSGPNPTAQKLTIQNTGGALLDWTATLTPSSSWLKLNQAAGSLDPNVSADLAVSVDVITTGLSAGTYPGSILFASPDPAVASKTVDVNLTVSEVPSIGVLPATVTFDTPTGSNPPNQAITITNIGGGTLNWIASDDATWLSLSPSPTHGSLTKAASAKVTLLVDTSGLPAVEATYTAKITIGDEFDATIPQQQVDVTLNVNASPKIGLNPATLEFTVPEDSGGSSPQAVSVTNTGFGVLSWGLTGGTSWLKTSKLGGSLNELQSEPMQISVNPKGLVPGVYSTTVQIEDPNASNSPVILAVQMTVKASSLPTSAPAGQCGLLGLEALAALLLLRTLISRGVPRCF